MNPFKKATVAALAIAVVATGTMAQSTSAAHAGKKHFGAGLAIGLIGGIAAAAAHRNSHRTYERTYVRECWWEDRVRYNRYGDRVIRSVKVCS